MRENEKILGVLGGMGPLATQLFYKMIIEMTDAHSDQEHINMIILSHATMPDRTAAILNGRYDEIYELLLNDARMLEENGASCIAIPCNTSHFFVDRLRKNVGIPLINMIEETVLEVGKAKNIKKIGILATDGTIRTELYQKQCIKQGLVPITLSTENQRLVMKIIYDGIKDGGEIDINDFKRIEEELKGQACDCAVMACTELSCFKKIYGLSDYYIDAMEVLARKSILMCGKKFKKI